MKESWYDICVGDIITAKIGNKYKCVYVSDTFVKPLTKSDEIEVIDFYSKNINTYEISIKDFVNIDITFDKSIVHNIEIGSLVKIHTSSGPISGTVISKAEPVFRPYPKNPRKKIHTFFMPQYKIMFTDNSMSVIEERKIKVISKP